MSDELTLPYPHAETMRDHWWWRPGWRVGRRFYSIFATFERDDALHELIDTYQSALAPVSGLTMIPRQWRHLTIQGVGFVDEITPAELDAIVAAVGERLATMDTSEQGFGPLSVHQEALVLPAIPQEPLVAIKAAIRAGIASAIGSDRLDGPVDGFRPHVTVAYNDRDRDSDDVLTELAQLEVASVPIPIRTVQILEVDRDERMYRWRYVRTIRLAM
ncbi:MAG TPA: 2'-5' RNA ligase family protein [Jiangellaceae bacterium]